MQKTNFDYEIVIVEDYSTDSTRDIVIDFQRRYPDKIRLVLSEKNKNNSKDFATAFQASPSHYVAWLDGDDYWTSSHKLQRQADFLDAHPECAMCFHNVTVFYEDGSRESWYRNPADQKKILVLEDLWAYNFIAGCSPMFRNGLFDIPDWYYNTEVPGDWPLYILSAEHGKIGYIDEIMGVYRIHSRGFWAGLESDQQVERVIEFYRNMNHGTGFRYKDTIDYMISRCRRELALQGKLQQGIRRVARRTLPVRVRRWIWTLWDRQP